MNSNRLDSLAGLASAVSACSSPKGNSSSLANNGVSSDVMESNRIAVGGGVPADHSAQLLMAATQQSNHQQQHTIHQQVTEISNALQQKHQQAAAELAILNQLQRSDPGMTAAIQNMAYYQAAALFMKQQQELAAAAAAALPTTNHHNPLAALLVAAQQQQQALNQSTGGASSMHSSVPTAASTGTVGTSLLGGLSTMLPQQMSQSSLSPKTTTESASTAETPANASAVVAGGNPLHHLLLGNGSMSSNSKTTAMVSGAAANVNLRSIASEKPSVQAPSVPVVQPAPSAVDHSKKAVFGSAGSRDSLTDDEDGNDSQNPTDARSHSKSGTGDLSRKEQKRAANRRSAQLSRKRKKQFIEELKDENDDLRRKEQILKCIPDLVVVFDSTGKLWFVSNSIKKFIRYNASELEGKSFWERLCPDSVRSVKSAFMDSLAAQNSAGAATVPLGNRLWDLNLVDKDGKLVAVSLHGVVHFAGERPECVCCIRLRDESQSALPFSDGTQTIPRHVVPNSQTQSQHLHGVASQPQDQPFSSFVGDASNAVGVANSQGPLQPLRKRKISSTRISDSGHSSAESESASSDELRGGGA